MLSANRTFLAGLCIVVATPALAHGSLAIGVTIDPAKDGIATGVAYNFSTPDAAQETAIAKCKEFSDAPDTTRARCVVVATFQNQCAAVALDPTAGQPGWGYAIDPSGADADAQALAMCRLTSPDDRSGACVISLHHCDGTAAAASN
jgi:Domain of unknown function (DUF4189)